MRNLPLSRINRRVTDVSTVFRGDIVPWLMGDHDLDAVEINGVPVVELPPGLWTVGESVDAFGSIDIDFHRTDRTYIRPLIPGSAIIDLGYYGGTNLHFGDRTGVVDLNLVLGGLEIKRGHISVGSCTDFYIYHSDLSFDRIAWWSQVIAAVDRLGGSIASLGFSDRDPFNSGRHIYGPGTPVGPTKVGLTSAEWLQVFNEMASFFGPIRIEGSTGASQRIGLIASDIHDSVDDGTYSTAWNTLLRACRIWNITEFHPQLDGDGISVDPGHPLFGGTGNEDMFHNDAVQLGSFGWKPVIENNWLSGRIMWSLETHTNKKIANGGAGWEVSIKNNWFGGALSISGSGRGYSSGLMLKKISDEHPTWPGRVNDLYDSSPCVVVAASTANAPDHSGTIKDNISISRSGSILSYPVASSSAFTNLITSNNIRSIPSGITDVFNENQIKNHPDNPATVWKSGVGHSYEDMITPLIENLI